MAEERPVTSGLDRKRTGASYASQWNRFVDWCEESGSSSLPASPEDVAAYLKDRRETGAKPSTLKVAAAAIARSHREAGFDVAAQQGVARAVLEELTQGRRYRRHEGAAPGPGLLPGHQGGCQRAAQRKGRARGTGAQRPPAGDAGRGDDRPDAGREAPGVRGGGVDLGRPGAGAWRVRPACASKISITGW